MIAATTMAAAALWASSLTAGDGAGAGSGAAPHAAARALIERLQRAGRAEARLERTTRDALSGEPETVRGALALEPPNRASLRFPVTGERVTMRADGGEWIQPQLRQMIRFGPRRAAAALRWWELFAPDSARRIETRRLAARHYLVVARARGGADADSAWVWLDGDGLPARLEIEEEPGLRTRYRFSEWRFPRARGEAAFRLEAPEDFEVVRLP